jgi:DNA-binding winged helix-turn-helix (wHTH) protein/tetratricopeptide (TPR) repeat protein
MQSAHTPPVVVRFGVFEADLRAGELRRNGIRVRLQDLPFRVLTLLLSRPGEVITREEFRQALWPSDVFVDFEQGVSSAMMRLRDALKDSAENPVFIETIERRGYRWIGPIHPPEPAAGPGQELAGQDQAAQERAALGQPVQGKGGIEVEEALWQDAAHVDASSRSRSYIARAMIFALPVLVLVFALWVVRAGNRKPKLGGKSIPVAAASSRQPANREAEDFYLKGRFYCNKRTPESLNQAVEAFSQAIARDPNYSEAYVGLSDSYNLLREFSVMPANEAYFKAFAAAKKAVELDPQSAEAHTSLAFVNFWGMWDAQDAEKEFRRAIELDPNNSKAHHWFATFLHAIGRHSEALTEIDRARELDPHSSSILADKGMLLWYAGHHEQSLQLLKQLEAAEPDFVSPHRYLRFAYFETGNAREYVAEFKAEALLIHDPVELSEAEAAAKGLAKGGERAMIQSQLAEQMALYKQGKLSPYFVAESEAKLGHNEEALNYLKICIESHDGFILNASLDQSFSSLRDNPTFKQFLTIAGLKPVS